MKLLLFLSRLSAKFAILLFWIGSTLQVVAQDSECQGPADFLGVPESGFCIGQLPTCTTTLGTSITESSQIPSGVLSGTICIEGNFTISSGNAFLFVDATVIIAPGVEIIVNPFASLTIDNSELHGCNGLWKGIRLTNNSAFFAFNNSLIEDAIKAVNASYVFAQIQISNTTFNRNLTGIWLEDIPNAPNPPYIASLESVNFTCNSSIVGTIKQISDHGIYSLNCPVAVLHSNEVDDHHLLFRGLKYGILIEGARANEIKGSSFNFREIRYAAIKMQRGKIDLLNSQFVNYGDRAISLSNGLGLTLKGCQFQLLETDPKFFPAPSPGIRMGIEFGPDYQSLAIIPEVDILDKCSFTYNCPGVDEVYYGITLNGLTQFNTTIYDNDFLVSGQNAEGIHIQGVDHPLTTVEIFENRFSVSAPFPPYDNSYQAYGIAVRGQVENIHIVGNVFDGTGEESDEHHYVINEGINIYQTKGFGHQMISNRFYGTFWAGAEIFGSSNWKICSNRSFFVNRVFLFWNDNMSTDFSENTIFSGGFDIDGKIYTQDQKDNTFYSFVTPSYARCLLANCQVNSRFLVRQALGTEYYPEAQICGLNSSCLSADEFFKNQTGSTHSPCASELQDPGDENWLLSVANGNIDDPNAYPAKQWVFKNHLFATLKGNPDLLSSNPAFLTFIQNESTTALGQFFEVDRLFVEAISPSSTGIDLQKLQTAVGLNNNISALTIFEQNQKTVNQILLASFLNQAGELTAVQIETLEQIANQCTADGGPAVEQAASLIFNKKCTPIEINQDGNCAVSNILPYNSEELEARKNKAPNSAGTGYFKVFVLDDVLTIALPEGQNGVFYLFDMKGTEMYSHKVSGNEEILQVNSTQFLPGVYIASFSGNTGYTTKVVLTH